MDPHTHSSALSHDGENNSRMDPPEFKSEHRSTWQIQTKSLQERTPINEPILGNPVTAPKRVGKSGQNPVLPRPSWFLKNLGLTSYLTHLLLKTQSLCSTWLLNANQRLGLFLNDKQRVKETLSMRDMNSQRSCHFPAMY